MPLTQSQADEAAAASSSAIHALVPVTPPIPPDPPIPPVGNSIFTLWPGDYTMPALTAKIKPQNFSNGQLYSIVPTPSYQGKGTLQASLLKGVVGAPEMDCYFPSADNIQPVLSFWVRLIRRYAPGYTTVGSGSGEQATKILGWAWEGFDNRGTLDVTWGNYLQLSFGANSGSNWVIPFVNSYNQGAQTPQIITPWQDGQFYQYTIQYLGGMSPRAQAWIGLPGATGYSPILHVAGQATQIVRTNRVQAMNFYNQSPTTKNLYTNDALIEVSTGVNPWNLGGAW